MNLRTITVAWMFGIVWAVCITGGHVPVFGQKIGFSEFDFGLMAAIPFMATFSQMFAAIIIERTGLRKYQFLHCATIHRAMWIPIAMIPFFLPIPSRAAVVVLLLLTTISWLNESLGRVAWTTWMGDLIPRRIRGRYFAIRARLSQLVMVLAVILVGVFMDHNWQFWSWMRDHLYCSFVGYTDADRDRMLLNSICGIFIVGSFFGMKDILSFRKIRDVATPVRHVAPADQPSLWEELRSVLYTPLKDKSFRHFVAYTATVTFSINFSAIYFWLFCLNGLGFNQLATNILFLVITPLADLSAARTWGRLIDRFGRKPVLLLATTGATLSILPWFFAVRNSSTPLFIVDSVNWIAAHVGQWLGHPGWVWLTPDMPFNSYLLAALGSAMVGASWSGYNLANLGIVLSFSDGKGRSKTVASSYIFLSIGGFLGGVLGGALANALKDMQPVTAFLWGNLQATFAVSFLVRLAAFGWLVNMHDPGSKPIKTLLLQLRENLSASRFMMPLRMLGAIREVDPKEKSARSRHKK